MGIQWSAEFDGANQAGLVFPTNYSRRRTMPHRAQWQFPAANGGLMILPAMAEF
jgi:hypothetical protein